MRLINGFSDTFTLLAFRWQTIPKRKYKVILAVVFLIGLSFLYMAANTGSLLISAATMPEGYVAPQTRDLAVTYLKSFSNNELSVFVSGVLGATVAMIFVTPFSGYSLGGIISSRDMSTVKSNDNYKLSDSILVQGVSSLSILQLLSLTFLSSLLTIEGGTGAGIIFGWFAWIALVVFTVAFMWSIEYVNRRYGFKTKVAIILGLVGLVVAAILIDPFHGTTFFGLSPLYVNVIQSIGTSFSGAQIFLSFASIIALIVIFGLVINFVGGKTLTYVEPVMFKKGKQGKINIITQGAKVSFTKLMLVLIFRYKVVWRPVLITTVMAALFVVILGNSNNMVLASFIVATPLVVSMSFGVNLFGVLGSANIWLVSLPEWRRTALYRLVSVQMLVMGVSYGMLFIPALVLEKFSFGEILHAVPAALAIMVIMSLFSVTKSLNKPIKYVPSSRGDSILPPVTMLSYMLQLVILGGVIGGGIYSLGDPLQQWGALALVTVVSYILFTRLNRKWLYKEEYVNKVIELTTGD